MPTDCVLVLTTLARDADADAFAASLVEERLAACVNVMGEMRSTYRWQGKVERDTERQVFIKTTRARLDALEARVRELHSYEVPELIVIPIDGGSDTYLNWLREALSATR